MSVIEIELQTFSFKLKYKKNFAEESKIVEIILQILFTFVMNKMLQSISFKECGFPF